MSLSSFNIYQQLTSARLTSDTNVSGVYNNGILGNGLGSSLTFSSSFTQIDSVTFLLGDRILLTNQTNAFENGIYVVTQLGNDDLGIAAVFTRSPDFQSIEQMKNGQFITIGDGASNSGSIFVLVNPLPQHIGIAGNDIIFLNNVDTGSDIYLKIANNLSDVADVYTSYENLGFGSGTKLSLVNSDFLAGLYKLTNPPPKIVSISSTNPGNLLALPSSQGTQALTIGQYIELSNILGSDDVDIADFSDNVLYTISAGQFIRATLVDNSTPAGTWDIQPFSGVVTSWDGSLTPVNITAGDGVDITDGVISLTGTGSSVGYSYITNHILESFGVISYTDNTTYLIPFSTNSPLVNESNNFAPFYDGASHLGVQYTDTEDCVAHITFIIGIQYPSVNTNPASNTYVLSVGKNGATPINAISGGSASDIPFTVNPAQAQTAVVITVQVDMSQNDVIYPVIRNTGSNTASLNRIFMPYYTIIADKVGDIGGTDAGVASLNGLTGNTDITSSDSRLNVNVVGNDVDLTLNPVPIAYAGTNATSYSSPTGVFYFNNVSFVNSNRFTYDNTTTTLAITANIAGAFSLLKNTGTDQVSTIYNNNWNTGVRSSSNNFSIWQGGFAPSFFIDTSDNVNIPKLTVSQLTGTDSSKNLVSGNLTGDVTTAAFVATLATVNASPNTYGSATQVPVFVVNAKGLVTSVTNTTITGTAPGGAAGGDLTGTYPNPTVTTNAVTYAKFQQVSALSIVGNATNSLATATNIAAGSDNQVFRRSGTAIGFGAINLASSAAVTGVLPEVNGGTNQSSYTLGDIIYSSAANTLSKLAGNITAVKQYLSQTGNGSVSAAPAWATISAADIGAGTLAQARGGTNATSYGANRVIFQNSGNTAFSSAASLTYNGTDTFILSTTGASVYYTAQSTTTGGGNAGGFKASRGDINGFAEYLVQTGSTSKWSMGLRNGDDSLHFYDQSNLVDRFVMTQAGLLQINALTASLPVFTDASKNLTNTGIVPIANGGTNQSSFATPVSSLNTITYYDGTRLQSNVKFGFNSSFDVLQINSNLANPQISVITSVTGSANSASSVLTRGDQANGGAFNYYLTGATTNWLNGTYSTANGKTSNSNDFIFSAFSGIGDILFLGYSTGDVTANLGNLIVNTAGKTLKIKQGSNACSGTGAVLVAGTVTVNTTAVATGDTVMTSCSAAGGVQGIVRYSIVNGTSFTLTSSNPADTSTYSWFIVKPA